MILIITTICSVLASCAGDGFISESDTNDATDVATDENGEEIFDGSDLPTDNGGADVEEESEDSSAAIQIFANGAYTAKLIRGESAKDFEKELYTEIKDLFKKLTGVNPEATTDYVAAGAEKYNGPAILIGETNYSESKTAYNKLGNDQATATISGNKYVIAVSSKESADKLLASFKTILNKKGTKTSVSIDSAWKISLKDGTSSSGGETFDSTGLVNSATLPSLGTSYNSGQGSKTYIKTNANKATFDSICKSLETNKFKKYTTNTIGTNCYATYVTQTQIVHVMFFPNLNQVRTAVDKRGTGSSGFVLPGLSGENKYTKTTESKMIVCDIGNADWPGGMCIIFKLADGRFFIVDAGIGGIMSDGRSFIGSSSSWIYETLAKHASDPKNIKVAAWLITHVHSDHAGGLYDMALGYYGKKGGSKHTVMPKEIKQYIKIDKIIYNSPDNLPDCNRESWMGKIISAFNVKNVVKAHAGQVFYFADLKFTVYGSLDIMIEDEKKCGDTNEFSLSIRVEFNGKSILLLGDSDKIPNAKLATIYKQTLKSDILQLAHHGYGDTGDAKVNSYCNPSWILWVVSNGDLRSNYKVNQDTSIASLSNVKHYKPGTDNLVFDSKWEMTRMTRSSMVDAIKKCDGSMHGGSCSTKPSFKNKYT